MIDGSHFFSLRRKHAKNRPWLEDEEENAKMRFVMEEGVKYRIFLNPRSEYLAISNFDIKPPLMVVEEANEQ